MVDTRNSYKIQLQIRSENDNEIYFKRDGSRFDSEFTVKFSVETKYEFTVLVRPSLPLQSVSVQGVGVSVTDSSQDENGASKYSFSWSAVKVEANKKKKRTKIQLMLQFQGGLTLILPLQVKFYKIEDIQHLTWGSALHQIEYDCLIKSSNTYLDIVKETFR